VATNYTVEEYAKAILYWGRRVLAGGETELTVLNGTAPEFPPLMGCLIKRDHCPEWVDAVCSDWTFLPPAAEPEPPRPMTLAFRKHRLAAGRVPDDPLDWARSVYYWSNRPRRETERPNDLY
jgi:hypothetical protein